MISKERFVQTMQRLKELDHNMCALDDAMSALSPNFGGFYIPEAVDITMGILKDIFNDQDDWLEYLAYELDYLDKYEPGMVLDVDDELIDVGTWEKAYDFLIDNMEG